VGVSPIDDIVSVFRISAVRRTRLERNVTVRRSPAP
jgi:hypothetical protein